MKLFTRLETLPSELRGGALTIGNFDGVHRGHARIIEHLKKFASELGRAAIVFTFDPHPVRILRPEMAPPPLTWTRRKADLLAELGVDAVIAYPTNAELLQKTYDEFFQHVICDKIGAAAMVEGPNFYFGRNREGDTESLRKLCSINKIQLEIVNPLTKGETYISSSRIRELVKNGDVGEALNLLTHPYRVRGMVTHGAARGAELGFPTANLDAIDTLVPAFGVYAGHAYLDNRPHWAAIHIGPNPTFGEMIPKVEIHILDFESSLYGQPLEVDFVQKLRDIRQFDSVEQLKEQLAQDVQSTRKIARQNSSSI